MAKLQISLSEAFKNKDRIVPYVKGDDYDYEAREVTVRDFIKHVLSGKAWAVGTYTDDHRHKTTFLQSGVLALDFDVKDVLGKKGVSVAKCLQNAAIGQWGALAHPTVTSSTDHNKTRVVFVLDKSIADGEKWELAQRACLHHFRDLKPDASCKNRSRMFMGCNRGEAHERPDAVLPITEVKKWVETYQAHIAAEREAEQKVLETGPGLQRNDASDDSRARYSEATYQKIRDEFLAASKAAHNRNELLNKAAHKLFGMSKSGTWPGINDARIEMDLTIDARSIGHDSSFTAPSVQATLRAAKSAAEPKPLVLSEKYTSLAEYNIEEAQREGVQFKQATMNSIQAALHQFSTQVRAGELSPDKLLTLAEKLHTLTDTALTMSGHVDSVPGYLAARSAGEEIKRNWENPQWIQGLRTGIKALDYTLGGLDDDECVTVLGTTGTGKTQFCATLAVNLKGPGAIVSCESRSEIFIMRMWAYLSRIPFGDIRRGCYLVREERDGVMKVVDTKAFNDEEKARIKSAQGQVLRIMDSGTEILENKSPSPSIVKAFIRKHADKCKWVILDSLNDIHLPYFVSEYEDVSFAAMTADQIASTYHIPVINTVQIGRNTKGRAVKVPTLHDARGSGRVEEKAAKVLWLYNHWYHVEKKDITEKTGDKKKYPHGTVNIGALKLRDGALGMANNVRYLGGCGYYND